jgi:xylose isomerase
MSATTVATAPWLFPYPLRMPYWCVENPVPDPFGPGILNSVNSLDTTDLLCFVAREGLIMGSSAHDDDLVPWNPYELEDDMDPSGQVWDILHQIKAKQKAAGLAMRMVTCNLHSNPLFRNGGLSNPDPRIRLLAAQKVFRTIRIGNLLGAEYLTYWDARDGWESQFAVPWLRALPYIVEGANAACSYAKQQGGSIKKGSFEPKPNEPRGEMFVPTTGHALAIIAMLQDPSFWSVNPELLQHEGMTMLSALGALNIAYHAGKLDFFHIGGQKPGQFDNDHITMFGMAGLKETIAMFWFLGSVGSQCEIEFDNHVLRTDCAPGDKLGWQIREDFIRLNVSAVRMAEEVAIRLLTDPALTGMQSALWDQYPSIAEVLSSGNLDAIMAIPTSYDDANGTPVQIARLDQQANAVILGLID